MLEFMYTFLIIGGIFGLSFVLMNIRHIMTGKEFRGTCASNNSLIKGKIGECSVCGKSADEKCQLPEPKG